MVQSILDQFAAAMARMLCLLVILTVTKTRTASPWVSPDCLEEILQGDRSCMGEIDIETRKFDDNNKSIEPITCGKRFFFEG